MTTEQELKTRDFDAWCEPEFYKVLEKEVARLERGALPYSDKQIGDMLGCTKSEVYNFRRRQHIPDGMGRMANCCANVIQRYYRAERDIINLKAELEIFRDDYETRGKLLRHRKKEKVASIIGRFLVGFFAGIFFTFLYALLFYTPAA